MKTTLFSRCVFLSSNKAALFEYKEPIFCVIDVRSVYQFLAKKRAGAKIRLKTREFIKGVKALTSEGKKLGDESVAKRSFPYLFSYWEVIQEHTIPKSPPNDRYGR